MKYISTRNINRVVSGAQAIVEGISPDGGLYVPEKFPVLSDGDWQKLKQMDYTERAAYVLSLYLDEFTYEELLGFAKEAYGRFYGDDPCPLVKVDEKLFFLELWHGPTCAFKDMALTMLPHLLTASKRKLGENGKTLILTATSGDTGKAAMEGFRDVEGTGIIVFYPSEGVSDMQRRQMITQEGDNVCVCAIKGNFDDAQSAVKRIFTSSAAAEKLAENGWKLSSANSINWGRLAPQIAYYVSAYCDLINAEEIKAEEKVTFVVPTGNFGDILAAYYAMRMGVPVAKLVCASNSNRVLTDFFQTGKYDTHRKFVETISPSERYEATAVPSHSRLKSSILTTAPREMSASLSAYACAVLTVPEKTSASSSMRSSVRQPPSLRADRSRISFVSSSVRYPSVPELTPIIGTDARASPTAWRSIVPSPPNITAASHLL